VRTNRIRKLFLGANAWSHLKNPGRCCFLQKHHNHSKTEKGNKIQVVGSVMDAFPGNNNEF
jgi:hypothetical protein